jgi:hypothetical protein
MLVSYLVPLLYQAPQSQLTKWVCETLSLQIVYITQLIPHTLTLKMGPIYNPKMLVSSYKAIVLQLRRQQ